MKKFRYLIILALVGAGLLTVSPLVPVAPVFAANVTFQGDVFAYNGQPAVGVTVCIYGTSNQCEKTTQQSGITPSAGSNDSAPCANEGFLNYVCSVWSFSVPTGATEQVQVKADPGDTAGSSYPNFAQALNLLSTDTVTINNNYALNLVEPWQAVKVHVQDDYGVAVGGIPLNAKAQAKEFDVNGNPANRRLLQGKAIVSLTLQSPGSYYQSAPTVSFGGGGSGASAIATIAGPVAAVDLNSAGGLCTSVPSVTFDPPPPGGTTATGHATTTFDGLSYTVTGVVVDIGGSGYTSQPGVHFSGGGCTPSATALINGSINSLTLNDGGSGYDPTTVSVMFAGGDSTSPTVTTVQATASATVGLASSGSSSYDDQATGAVQSDGSGDFTMYLLPSTLMASNYEYNICADPANNSNWGSGCTNGVDVTLSQSTTNVTVVIPRKVLVNGYVLAPPGFPSSTNGLAGVKVCYAGMQGQNGNPNGQGSACTTTSSQPNQSQQLLGPVGGNCDGDTTTGLFTFAIGCPYSYSLLVVPGSYLLQLSANYGDITVGEHAPQKFSIVTTQAIVFGRTPLQQAGCGWSSQNSGTGLALPQNSWYAACWYEPITLPEEAYTETVKDSQNNLLSNIPLDASSKSMEIPAQGSNSTIDGVPWAAQATYDHTQTGNVATDNNGQAVLYLFPEPQNSSTFNYNVTAISNQVGLTTTTVNQFVSPATTSGTIVMHSGATISGNIYDADNRPVGGVTVSLETKQGLGPSDQTASTTTDGNGHYSIRVMAGAYFLKVSTDPGSGGTGAAQTELLETAPATATRSSSTPTYNLTDGATVTQNLTLPVWQVDVETQDSGNIPLAGSSIDAQSPCPQGNLPLTTVSALNPAGVAGVIVTSGGNYTQPPTVSFSGGSGSGAAGFANVDPKTHAVTSVTITNPGSGYQSAPTVSFSPSGAAGTAIVGLGGQGCTTYDHTKTSPAVTVKGAITSIQVTNQGTGYFNPPTVSFSGGGGSGAAAIAALDGSGHVIAIEITNPGSGYTSAPLVNITGAGSNAAATATFGTAATLFLLDTHYAGQNYMFTAYPTVSPYVTTTMANVPITGDMTELGGNPLVIQLKAPVAFGGTIMADNSNPAENVTVSLLNAATSSQSGPSNVVESAQTDANGNFSFPNKVPPQAYILKISANPGDGQVNAPQQFTMQTTGFSLNLQSDTTNFQLTLPEHTVTTTVQDPVGNTVSGSPLAAAATCPQTGLSAGGMTFTGCSTYAFGVPGELDTDQNGQATLWLLNSTTSMYSLSANPPGGNNLLPATVNNVSTTSNQSQTITLQVPVLVTGTVVAGNGTTPASHVTVGVEMAPGGKVLDSGVTDSNGKFSFTAPSTATLAGYYFKLSASPGAGQTGAPQTLLVETRSPVSVVPADLAQTTMNLQTITLPENPVTVNVCKGTCSVATQFNGVKISAQSVSCPQTGAGGLGIPLSDAGGALDQVKVNACSTFNAFALGPAITAGAGTVSLWLVPTTPPIGSKKADTYTVTVYPPTGTPQYLQGTKMLVNVTGLSTTVTFNLAHR